MLSGSLTYSAGGHALTTLGNSVQLTNNADATRHLNDTYGTDGTSRWLGFEFVYNGTGNADLSLQTTEFRIGNCASNKLGIRAMIGSNNWYGNSTITPVAGTTYFLVARIDYGTQGSGQDVARLWVNPTPGVLPSDASANGTITLPVGTYYTSGNTLKLYTEAATNQPVFDELRWGMTYCSVAPDPLVEDGGQSAAVGTQQEFRPAAMPIQAAVASRPGAAGLGLVHSDEVAAEGRLSAVGGDFAVPAAQQVAGASATANRPYIRQAGSSVIRLERLATGRFGR